MFIIKSSETFFWPVEIKLPVSGGKYEKQTFDAEFRHLPQSRIRELIAGDGATDLAFCREIMVGWRGIVDEKKEEIPFSASMLEGLLERPVMAATIATTYLKAIQGEAQRKN